MAQSKTPSRTRLSTGLAGDGQRWLAHAGRILSLYRLKQFGSLALQYFILFELAYVFLFPLMYVISTSMKSDADLVDPTVVWIPRAFYKPNFELAIQLLDYWPALRNSFLMSMVPAIGQTLSCALAGYGLARYRFPGREIVFLLVILVFLIPPQVFVFPLFTLFGRLEWLSTVWPIFVPSWIGHGLKGGLFVIICRQFFRGLPWELEEAALVDGAGPLMTFWRIVLPLAQPALVVVFLFSFVWHWNDRFETGTFLFGGGPQTLQLKLASVSSAIYSMGQMEEYWSEGLAMAAVLLVILPVLVVYLFTQRNFVESISRTGLIE